MFAQLEWNLLEVIEMAICKISKETAAQLYEARSLTGYDRKTKKSQIISQIKRDLGIPSSAKIRINTLNPDSPEYLLVRNKWTGAVLTNNLPEPKVSLPAAPAPAAVPAAKKVAVAKPVPAAKKVAVAKPVPAAKKVAVAKPVPAAKKVAVAKPVPAAKKVAVAKPTPMAKKVAVAKPTPTAKKRGSTVKTAKFAIEVRPSIGGKRVRLGYASSEAEKAKMIAEYKATL